MKMADDFFLNFCIDRGILCCMRAIIAECCMCMHAKVCLVRITTSEWPSELHQGRLSTSPSPSSHSRDNFAVTARAIQMIKE